MSTDRFDHPAAAGAAAAAGQAAQIEVDVAIVGAGGAGLGLVIALEAAARRTGVEPPSIALIDPVHRTESDRTWCWWADVAEPNPSTRALLPLAYRAWARMQLVDVRGAAREYPLGALRYLMVRSADFYAEAEAALARYGPRGQRITGSADLVQDGPVRALVQVGDRRFAARWVFDSRPARPTRAGSTMLLQHFRGWTVRFDRPLLDPDLATLMDFRVPQPARGVAFGYCLPLDRRRALVEYTEFSREPLPSAGYDRALRDYLRERWDAEIRAEPEQQAATAPVGLSPSTGTSTGTSAVISDGVGAGVGAVLEAVENGVIPMTDASFARRVGERVFRIGTAGGATRPSTGYTFATMQRQAVGIADLLLAGRTPVPPQPYPSRHRWMDAVLLRALDRGYLAGPALFSGLFADQPTDRVVRFLDGVSRWRDELAVMRSVPMLPMVRATIEDAAARLDRRGRALFRPDRQ